MGILLEYKNVNVPQFKYFVSESSLKTFIKENKLSEVILHEDEEFTQPSLDEIEKKLIKDLIYWFQNGDITDSVKDDKSNSITFVVNDESQIEDMVSAIKTGEKFDDVENGVIYENTPIVFVSKKNKSKRSYFIDKLNNHIKKPEEETDADEELEPTEEQLSLKTGFETLKKEYDSGSHPILNDDNLVGKKLELKNDSIDIFVNDEASQKIIVQWLNKSGLDQDKTTTVKDSTVSIDTNKYNVVIGEESSSEELSEEEVKAELDKKYSKDNILEYLQKTVEPGQLATGVSKKDIVSKKDKLIIIYVADEKAKKAIITKIVKDYKDMSAVSLKNGNGVAIYSNIIAIIDPTEVDDEDKITRQLTKDLQQNMNDMYKSALEKGISMGSSFADTLETQY